MDSQNQSAFFIGNREMVSSYDQKFAQSSSVASPVLTLSVNSLRKIFEINPEDLGNITSGVPDY